MELKYRHEIKHVITASDRLILRQRLSAVMKKDAHAKDGIYNIRSLYFDNLNDKALFEKITGVSKREKFRIRYYDGDTSYIQLEKKSKINNLCNKQSANLTKEEAENIANGNYEFMINSDKPLVKEFYTKIMGMGLRPKTIVDYTREPFIYGPGNVRVTIDYNIRTGIGCTDFLNANAVTVPAGDSPIILEVKWDEYLPDIIRDIVQLDDRQAGAFSKYVACRIYG